MSEIYLSGVTKEKIDQLRENLGGLDFKVAIENIKNPNNIPIDLVEGDLYSPLIAIHFRPDHVFSVMIKIQPGHGLGSGYSAGYPTVKNIIKFRNPSDKNPGYF